MRKVLKIKRQGNLLLGSILSLIILFILSGGIYFSFSNMISFENTQKKQCELLDALVSETNKYNSLDISLIQNTSYTIDINKDTADVSIDVIDKEDNFIKFNITTTLGSLSKTETIQRNK